MGLLECRAMPSLRDMAHDGDLCTFSNRSAPDRGKCVRQGSRHGPSIMYKITPCWSLSSSQPGGPPFRASPLAFGLISGHLQYMQYNVHRSKQWRHKIKLRHSEQNVIKNNLAAFIFIFKFTHDFLYICQAPASSSVTSPS